MEFCRYRSDAKKNNLVDLSKAKWFYPTTLLPLASFLGQNKDIGLIMPNDHDILNYFSLITKNSVPETAKSFIPIIKAKKLDGRYIDQIYAAMASQEDKSDIGQSLKYVIGELVDNIDQHSKCNLSVFMAQDYKKKGFLEASFFDNGITIPGSFKKANMGYKGKKVNKSDVEYIEEAINGASTKPEGGRGHGLPSIIKILKDMHSNIFIISGKGAIYIKGTDKYMTSNILYNADEYTKLKGTLVSFQISHPINYVNIYEKGYL
jgi:hypothetical protein